MRKSVIARISLVIVVILTLFFVFRTSSPSKVNTFEHLQKLEAFHQNSIQGAFVLVHFWAKWCEPCADEIPHLVSFARKVEEQKGELGKPLKILAISLDPSLEESKTILPEQGKNLPADFILLSDPEHKVAEEMGSYQYPETYLIDPEGTVLEKWIGPQKWDTSEVLEFFKHRVR